ncbi:MAG: hypothetical protein HQ582_09770 [Planctomycetes bacterium]|nr:hypothetical protein [Planctomycetota bacterium]
MSPLIAALLALAAPPGEGAVAVAPPQAATAEKVAVSTEQAPLAEKAAPYVPRTGEELRAAIRAAMRRWARPSNAQADAAAREFITIHGELKADDQLARSQREYFLGRLRSRLMRLSDQITVRIAHQKRLAKSGRSKSGGASEEKAASPGNYVPELSSSGGAFGGGAMLPADNGQQLVDLIQTVIRPETWDINGGPGSIYYWRPGRALVIRQMGDVHEQVGGVLGQLRRAGQ